MQRMHLFSALGAAAVLGAAIVAAPQRGPAEERSAAAPISDVYFSASRIISYDDTVGLLDTATGAVYGLEGNLDNAGAQMSWRLRVPPVRDASSGLLEVQRATFNHPEATFLVDVVRGSTWILRRRGPQRATWEPVRVQ